MTDATEPHAELDGVADALVTEAGGAGLELDPLLTVSEWADRERILGGKAAAEPGPWRTDRTPYLREIMDNLSARSKYERVVFMKGAQLGATEAGNNFVGYVIGQCPGPMLYVEPTIDMARKVSKQRVQPMIDSTPALRERVATAKSKSSDNTILMKEYPGGYLAFAGANSAVGLRMQAIRFLFCDEVDGYPPDVAGEGDPLELAVRRTDTFSGGLRKILIVSTPTVKGMSRIEDEYMASDMRKYNVPCPHCGTFQTIEWKQIRFDSKNLEAGVWLECLHCREQIEEGHKTQMLTEGRWEATAVSSDPSIVGYHLSGLYSPPGWHSWTAIVREFLQAKEKGHEVLKTWINTVLGETWEEEADSVDDEGLLARCVQYPARVPAGVLALTCGVDVQDDRVEYEVVGWSKGEESYGIQYGVIWGDPGRAELWEELTDVLSTRWPHEEGGELPISCACIDSGGHYTKSVYDFVKGKQALRWFAIKGRGGAGLPIVESPKKRRSGREQRHVELFHVGSDQARGYVHARLKQQAPGPGYCHFPVGHGYDPEYFRQLSAMRAVIQYVKGVGVRKWHVRSGARKEAFDCRMYALAALYILNPLWDKLAARRKKQRDAALVSAVAETPEKPAPRKKRRRRSGSNFVTGWRN